ncbi:ribosomal protein S7 [Saccharata proteae CBS 121410]|uniref:Small ribosomal subunit protein uS7m n=1 Tax=Saccharata proteae CBS 121410 TaxID=1314787 RepID=A0A6A5YCL7_9PEZI|nr:ribosomal protein S7 [Saccharata proteae CBS 121410]
MPPRLFLRAPRSIALRPGPSSAIAPRLSTPARLSQPALCQWRGFADASKDLPESTNQKGPNTEQLPHVSEEAAQMGKITGEGGPDISQGTPVEEMVQGDKAALEKLPKVMQDSIKRSSNNNTNTPPKGSRSFSTSAIRRAEETMEMSSEPAPVDIYPGTKFGMPMIPMPPEKRLKSRYDPIVVSVTNLLMRDGKLSVAQRNMAHILNHLRASPPPAINPSRPLLPGAPPPSHLPLNPVLYLQLAIDSVAPLLRLRSQKGLTGGGVALQIPVPLGLRQRRRTAVEWILQAAEKRRNNGSGKHMFATRVAQELVAVVEGKSSVWTRREGVHKLAVAARANLIPKRGKPQQGRMR